MNLSTYLENVGRGSLSALAKAVDAHAPDVSRWASGGRPVPTEKCAAIERATSGAVMRWDLRPDDWHLIWPELKKRKDAPKPKTVEA